MPYAEIGAEKRMHREFSAVLSDCRAGSALGLDGITYEVVKGFPERLKRFLLELFNSLFRDSSFPEFLAGGAGGIHPKT